MSAKEQRDAFVAGAWWDMMVCEGLLTVERAEAEALRRYPDAPPPAPAEEWECSEPFCKQRFDDEVNAGRHSLDRGHQVFRVDSNEGGKL